MPHKWEILTGNFKKDISGHQRLLCVCVCAHSVCFWLLVVFSSVGTTCQMNLDKILQLFNQTCLQPCLTCQEFNLRLKEVCGSSKEHSLICIGKLHWLFNYIHRRTLNWMKCKAGLDTACSCSIRVVGFQLL